MRLKNLHTSLRKREFYSNNSFLFRPNLTSGEKERKAYCLMTMEDINKEMPTIWKKRRKRNEEKKIIDRLAWGNWTLKECTRKQKCKWIFYEVKFSQEKQQFSRVHSLHSVFAFLFSQLLFNRIGIKINEVFPRPPLSLASVPSGSLF